jgi:hypothetical protein
VDFLLRGDDPGGGVGVDALLILGALIGIGAPTLYLYGRLRGRLEPPPTRYGLPRWLDAQTAPHLPPWVVGPIASSRLPAWIYSPAPPYVPFAIYASGPESEREPGLGAAFKLPPTSVAHLPKSPEVEEYLGRLRSSLHLPEGLIADVVQEMRDHIDDSREALMAEGLDPAAATREALARLGSATELAAHLQGAQRTARRMLAGAAGGVFAAPGAFGAATVAAFVVAGPLVVATAFACLAALGLAWAGPVWQSQLSSLAGVLAACAGCFYGSRTGVRIFAALSRRAPTELRGVWALVGTPIVAAVALFGLRLEQSWPLLAAEMLLPVAFAGGALYQSDRSAVLTRLKFPAVASLVVAVAATGLVAGLGLAPVSAARFSVQDGVPVYDESNSVVLSLPLPSVDMTGPTPVAWYRYPGTQFTLSPWSCTTCREVTVSATQVDAGERAGLPGWSDIRFEVWPGVKLVSTYVDPNNSDSADDRIYGGIERGAMTPEMTTPALRSPGDGGKRLTGQFRLGIRRDGPNWWVTLTGVAPDGTRYRLSEGTVVEADPIGSAWDWLTAPG